MNKREAMKRAAVAQLERGVPLADVARVFGYCGRTLQLWRKRLASAPEKESTRK